MAVARQWSLSVPTMGARASTAWLSSVILRSPRERRRQLQSGFGSLY
jgi:hypothetical protein